MACYILFGRRLRPPLPLALYSNVVYGGAALGLGILLLLRGLPLRGVNSFSWLMVVALALAPTGLGHNSLNWALKYLPATMGSVTILGEPLGASIMAVFILKEVPDTLEA